MTHSLITQVALTHDCYDVRLSFDDEQDGVFLYAGDGPFWDPCSPFCHLKRQKTLC